MYVITLEEKIKFAREDGESWKDIYRYLQQQGFTLLDIEDARISLYEQRIKENDNE